MAEDSNDIKSSAISKNKGPRIGVAGANRVAPKRVRRSEVKDNKAKTSQGPKTKVGEDQPQEKKKARKGAMFMGVVLIAYVAYIIFSGQGDEFIRSIQNTDTGWVIGGCLTMFLFIAFGALAFMFAAYTDKKCPVGFRDCFSIEASGTFFGNLTPMSTGTVPAQILRLTQSGLSLGEASAMQFTRFIFYQAGEVIFAAVLLLLKFQFFLTTYGDFVILNLVVFFIQTMQVVGLLAVCLLPKFVMRFGNKLLAIAKRKKWFKEEKIDYWDHYLNDQVMQFAQGFRASFKHKMSLFLTLLATFAQLVCYYSVPWFVLHAFGVDADFLTCLAAAAMVQMIANSVPLPGGTGGSEAGFAFFFNPIFGMDATAGFMLWRVISYFILTTICLPLMPLHSTSHRSIYERWNAFIKRDKPQAKVKVKIK